jgi:ribosomal protein S18 acetylase RimI-like enzyme
MGEEQRIAEFLKYYCDGGQQLRRACCEVLFEIRWPLHLPEDFTKLRPGTLRDLDLVAPVHAQMSWEESGVNPLESDPEGFRQRCSRRLQRNRTYVWIEDDVLLFKADVISETPEAAYIEGVWLHPSKSGNGDGLRCLTQLLKTLLARTESVCLLTNVENEHAQNFYRKAGFKERGMYDSIFLKSPNSDSLTSTH